MLSNVFDEAMTEICKDVSCVDIVAKDKTCLLILSKLEGKVVKVTEEESWRVTIQESVTGLMLSDKLAELLAELGEDDSWVDIVVAGNICLLTSIELECKVGDDVEDNHCDGTVMGLILSNILEKVGENDSCVDNVVEGKTSSLLSNVVEGELREFS